MGRFTMQFTDQHRRVASPAAKLFMSAAEYAQRRQAGQKWCPRHRGWAPLADFNRNRSNPDGYGSMCRDCQRVYQRKGGER